MMTDLYNKIIEAQNYLSEELKDEPVTGVILGTGLGGLVDRMELIQSIPYGQIPHFPVSTVKSHRGTLILGRLSGKCILVMSGRFHYYEGYSSQEITFPVRVMKALGIQQIIISNASGGINPNYNNGQIVLIKDHINLIPDHPLRGKNDDRLGVRFPDMKEAYDDRLREIARSAAEEMNYNLEEGVYVGFQGPTLETPAEYVYLHRIGGDMVGMSTVPEVIVAKHCEVPVLVLSLVSNVCYPPERIKETSLEDVIKVVGDASPQFCDLVEKIIGRI
jgi:purine-nucleoside phosphorylase